MNSRSASHTPVGSPVGSRDGVVVYYALTLFAILWPQLDVAETFIALRSPALIEGNPLFSVVFHAPLGLLAGLLLHAGISLAALAFAMFTHTASDQRIRRIGLVFLVGWVILGIIIVGHNGVVLWLHWLNSWLN